jgi:hypothetical protein
VVWGMLRNPAYRGVACFGKTRLSARMQMRPQRRRGITTPSNTTGHQRPREEWIEIPVPALVTEESFARAQELLYHNKIRSRRRIIVTFWGVTVERNILGAMALFNLVGMRRGHRNFLGAIIVTSVVDTTLRYGYAT